jgi:hypothetical protein
MLERLKKVLSMLKSISLLLLGLATIPSIKVVANQQNSNECDNQYLEESENDGDEKKSRAYTLYNSQEAVYKHEASKHDNKISNVKTDFGCVIAGNISQASMNARYNNLHPNHPVDQTCTEVAVTMAAKFYLDAKYRDTNRVISEYDIFDRAITYAQIQGWHSNTDGSKYNTGANILQRVLLEYDIESSYWDNLTNMYFGVKDFVGSPNYGTVGKVQLFGVQGHCMLAVGYYLISYDYEETRSFIWSWKVKKHADKMYIVVCDGFRTGKPASKEKFELERYYNYFELGTCERYINGIDIPEANYF